MLEDLIMQATDENDVDLEKLVELLLADVKTIIMESATIEEAAESIDQHFNLRDIRLKRAISELVGASRNWENQPPEVVTAIKKLTKAFYY